MVKQKMKKLSINFKNLVLASVVVHTFDSSISQKQAGLWIRGQRGIWSEKNKLKKKSQFFKNFS